MTQKQMILNYMRNSQGITPLEAEEKFGCMRLASRISDLRRDGHSIRMERVEGVNRFGKRMHYARYKLIKEVTLDE